MRLKLKNEYGQRDNRWANVLLGYNKNTLYNIGGWGCLITSLGNYVGKTPIEVNDILKANGGFTANSGNFIWSHCRDLGLAQTYQSPYYSGPVTSQGLSKMKSLLDQGLPLLTHVDFDPRDPDDDMHWLLVIGYENDDFFAFDPWTATHINLDVYGGSAARAVLEFRAYDKKLEKEGSTISIEQGLFEKLVSKSAKYDEFVKMGFSDPMQIENQIAKLNKNKEEVQKQNQALEDLLTKRNEEVEELKKELSLANSAKTNLQESAKSLSRELSSIRVELAESTSDNNRLKSSLGRCNNRLAEAKEEIGKLNDYIKDLVENGGCENVVVEPIFERFINWIKKMLKK